MDDFRIQFSAPDDLDVELRDIPMAEHIHEREERLLSGSEISSQEFTLVLDIYAIPTESGENYPLRILDNLNKRTIETIDIIA